MNNILCQVAIQPWHTALLTDVVYVGTVNTANCGQCTILHPTNVHIVGNAGCVATQVGGHVWKTNFRTTIDGCVNFLSESVAIGVDVARPLDGIPVGGDITCVHPLAVQATIDVTHDKCALCILANVGDALKVVVRYKLVSIHTKCKHGDIGMSIVKCYAPVAVVPPVVQTKGQNHCQLLVTILHFVVVQNVVCARNWLWVVVEHDVYA